MFEINYQSQLFYYDEQILFNFRKLINSLIQTQEDAKNKVNHYANMLFRNSGNRHEDVSSINLFCILVSTTVETVSVSYLRLKRKSPMWN